jgi:hypothetical protein
MDASDKLGRAVRVGDAVRIVGLGERFVSSLSPDERARVAEMTGKVFQVEEIDSE